MKKKREKKIIEEKFLCSFLNVFLFPIYSMNFLYWFDSFGLISFCFIFSLFQFFISSFFLWTIILGIFHENEGFLSLRFWKQKQQKNSKENQSEKSETNTKKIKPYFLFWFFSFFLPFFSPFRPNLPKSVFWKMLFIFPVFSQILGGFILKNREKCSFLKKRIFKW